jgi:hypothetical protein
LPQWYNDALQKLTLQSSHIANAPYQGYGGQRLAGINPLQNQAINQTTGNVGVYGPAFGQAMGSAQFGTQGALPNISNYMNPYQQGVTDVAKREATRDFGIQQNQRNASQVQAGAFGNTRAGVENAEAQRNLNQLLTDIQMKGSADAFTQAGQLYGADADRALKGAGIFSDLGTAQQSAGLRDAAALQAVGDFYQGETQKSLDLGYQTFLEQRDYPKSQAGWLSGILRGAGDVVPKTTHTTKQELVPQSSPLSQIAGAGLTAASLFNMLGGFKRGGRARRRRY